MQRRFLPLVVLLVLSTAILLARLWDVQVTQHSVWAREAANLVRSSAVDPYRRGDILDRRGRVLVRDEEAYSLEFVWRDFRRGHPLGQVAMMRSLVLMRPVGLDEAQVELSRAATSYASLSPADLDRFALGGELDAGIDYVPAIAADSMSDRYEIAASERRRSRAGDLRFYLLRLLDISPRDVREINEHIDDGPGRTKSFIELSAWVRRHSPEEVRDGLKRRANEAEMQLTRLARLIDWEDDAGSTGEMLVRSGGDRLIALMEERRSEVDDESARALFERAAGVSPTRLDVHNLRRFDLEWIRTALDWDSIRFDEWIERTGTSFERNSAKWLAAHTIARAKLEGTAPADRFVSAFAHAFRRDADAWSREHAEPEDWRNVEELAVLPALRERLARGDEIPEEALLDVLPFQRESLDTAALEGEELLRAVFGPDVNAARFLRLARRVGADWNYEDESFVAELLVRGHRTVQRRVRETLAAVDTEPLRFGAPYIEKALETRRYVIRDRGARPRVVGKEPEIDLVLLVTRYPDAFAGFKITSRMHRTPVELDEVNRQPIAADIVGGVRSPFLVDVLRQGPSVSELGAFQRKLELPEEDRREILRLVAGAYQRDEKVGGRGIEAWFDAELSGTSGYREVHGLQDRVEGNRAPIRQPAVDGQDVVMTLDVDLQNAALEVLHRPVPPDNGDTGIDEDWYANPVGAIVLATTDGRILCAASVPTLPGHEPAPYTDGQRAFAIDRTLLRPLAQPPGSVVKPLLAAYALEHLGLRAETGIAVCSSEVPREGVNAKRTWRAGYGVINCHSSSGHSRKFGCGKLPLDLAIKASCNGYFAALAEQYFDESSMRDAYRTFGFGQPTGVLWDDDGTRSGLRDAYWFAGSSPLREDAAEPLDEEARQFLGNGLNKIDANVVQVARAYAGLATGRLPRMRLVQRVGDKDVPARFVTLPISEENLETVRRAVRSVVADPSGSANGKGLSDDDLGFSLAAKTGSADYHPVKIPKSDPGLLAGRTVMRKHAWMAGWFPAEDPRFIVVVYLHDTQATASHSAVYVAAQFLQTEAVQSLVAEEGER